MHIVVGLGNPGAEYENTRHNIGFRVVESVASLLDIRLKAGKGDYLIGEKSIGGSRMALIKPLTYMNNSGWAVRDIIERYNLRLDELFVIVDDIHLPLGSIRLRMKGSDGGHNGLYSIIYHLGSADFARLRCGIGCEEITAVKGEMADFVLSSFEPHETTRARNMVICARDVVIKTVIDGFKATHEFLSRIKV